MEPPSPGEHAFARQVLRRDPPHRQHGVGARVGEQDASTSRIGGAEGWPETDWLKPFKPPQV